LTHTVYNASLICERITGNNSFRAVIKTFPEDPFNIAYYCYQLSQNFHGIFVLRLSVFP